MKIPKEILIVAKHLGDLREQVVFVGGRVMRLLENAEFLDALPGQLPMDEASQARFPLLLQRLRRLASFADSVVPSAPKGKGLRDVARVSHGDEAAIGESVAPLQASDALSWTPRRSSNIRRFSYEPTTSVLTVTFKDRSRYEYYDVPVGVFSGWKQALSAGRYHHQWVKRYDDKRLDN